MDWLDVLAVATVPAALFVIYLVWRFLPPIPAMSVRAMISVIAVAALAIGSVTYVGHFGQCSSRSKFCVISVAGTRSEIGCQWDTWSCYVSTYPANEPV